MDNRNTLFNHLLVALIAFAFALSIYLISSDLEPFLRVARSFSRTSFILLSITLSIGPLVRLWRPAGRILSWRGEFGTWFAIMASVHVFFIYQLMGWKPLIVLGIINTSDGYVSVNPGHTVAVISGMVAFIWTLFLALTSSGRAIKFLGVNAWKWLHGFVYVIFYLVAVHMTFFFLRNGFNDKFSYIAILMIAIVISLQISAFVKNVIQYRKGQNIINNN